MRHADHVVTRTMLLENVWGLSFRSANQRRRRFTSASCGRKSMRSRKRPLLRTVRNAGYMVTAAD